MTTTAAPGRLNAFAQARAQAEIENRSVRIRAARTVTGQAVSDDDRACLLSMLGLDETPDTPAPTSSRPADTGAVSTPQLERVLADYVHAVAGQLGVPAEATGFEVSDTVTAYLGLRERCADRPNRDLMLVWNERDGWLIAAETRPNEPAHAIGYLGGPDILPHPYTVARFVTALLGGQHPNRPRQIHPPCTPRHLATLLGRHRPMITSHLFTPQS